MRNLLRLYTYLEIHEFGGRKLDTGKHVHRIHVILWIHILILRLSTWRPDHPIVAGSPFAFCCSSGLQATSVVKCLQFHFFFGHPLASSIKPLL